MATFYGVWSALQNAGGPNNSPPVSFVGGRVRVFCEHIVYAAQASGSVLIMGSLPANAVLLGFEVLTDTTTGTTTLAIGDGATANKFATAAAYTTVDTPIPVGKTANCISTAALTQRTQIAVTTAVGALPGAGNLVLQTYYTID